MIAREEESTRARTVAFPGSVYRFTRAHRSVVYGYAGMGIGPFISDRWNPLVATGGISGGIVT